MNNIAINNKSECKNMLNSINKPNSNLKIESGNINLEYTFLKDEDFYELIIESSSDAIVIYSSNKFVYANYSACKLFGFNEVEQLKGLSPLVFMPNDKKPTFYEKVKHIFQNKLDFKTDFTKMIDIHKKELFVKLKGKYILYHGDPALLVILTDISLQKHLNNLEFDLNETKKLLNDIKELNKQMTEHFSNLSHELRTPLNVILNAIQLLNYYSNNLSLLDYKDKSTLYHKTIRQNCYRLMRLVNNLVDLSKIDSGFFKLNQKNSNIVTVLEDITLSVANYVESKGINLIFDTNVEEKYMCFDPDKIERILLNLLSNAVKFTNKGDEIFVSFEDEIDYVKISVKDTGAGIPKDKLEVIFERYKQADTPLTNINQGTGIGLSLVKSLVELHDGKINVKSDVGIGTEFSILLPVKLMEDCVDEKKELNPQTNVERISIEFADIYTINS